MDDRFSLSRILELKCTKEKSDDDIIEYHYEQAKMRIKDAYHNYHGFCYYSVPAFVSKLQSYNSEIIAEKLVRYMKKLNFQCRVLYGSTIIFEWKPKQKPQDHIPFILKSIMTRVEHEAKNNNDYLFYEIPAILPEFPWYDIGDTAMNVSKVIARKGFIVKILDNLLFICWNKEQIEQKSRIKINVETKEDKRKKAMDRISLINENRYVDFINPKRDKKSKVDFRDIVDRGEPDFDVNRVLHLY